MSFRTGLPEAVLERKIHNAFQASLLAPSRADLKFHRRSVPAPPAALSDGSVEYEFEDILGSHQRRSRVQDLVSRKGYDEKEKQWILAGDLQAPDLLLTFHQRRAS